jgi:hypothetical protein
MLKELYTFTVDFEKEVEESTQEKRTNDQGVEEEVEIKKKVKKEVPIEVLIKKPSRRQLEDAETEFSICMSECVKKGILTKAMLAKKYADTGGALAEEEARDLLNLYKEAAEIEREVSHLSIKGLDKQDEKLRKKLSDYDVRIAEIKRKIIETESDYRVLFNHTADVKAQNRVMMWYVLNLTYYKSLALNVPDYKLFFKGETFKDKMDDYYEKDEQDDELFLKVIGKVSAIISYWYFSGTEFNKEDVDAFLQDNDDVAEEIVNDEQSKAEPATEG